MPPRQRTVGSANTATKYGIYFIATVFLLLILALVLNMRTKDIDNFVAYSNWTIFLYPRPIIILGEAGEESLRDLTIIMAWSFLSGTMQNKSN